MSILSFPSRGKWGNSGWAGNCSGFVYQELFERLKPRVFVDPMVGSGTSVEVAREMGIESHGLDLHSGFNILEQSILERVGKHADLIVSHPPYWAMIKYAGNVWGTKAHPGDLSQCESDEEFHTKLQLALMNQREATVAGGVYGTILGDMRRNGNYYSLQSEAISRMPRDELASVMIKVQHATTSGRKKYGAMKFAPIEHEYILLWQRKEKTVFAISQNLARQAYSRLVGTWRNIVAMALQKLGGQATLTQLYELIASEAERVNDSSFWREKVRQVLNQNRDAFRSVERGVWAIVVTSA